MINTTSQVFLGLTLACARCHNHKFEALTMHDYYRMAAIFNTLQRPRKDRTEFDLPAGSREQVRVVTERNREIVGLGMTSFRVPLSPGDRLVGAVERIAVGKRISELRATSPDLPRGYFLTEPTPKAPATHLLIRGKASRPGPETEPGMPAVLVDRQPTFLPPDEHTSRRRLTLACWIASAENPLTARVIVNRVWQYHFGEGLVRTPSDFGVKGEAPTHPEMLDWLAHWFVKNGWSVKRLHRLILSSNTYRMSKRWNEAYGPADPEDRQLWRFPYRRLEVEAIRDSVLSVSGQLNRRMNGHGMFPAVPKEALEGSSDPDKIWKASEENEASRRTVYATVKRSMVVPLLDVLDFCDTARTTAKRNITSVAPQALSLFNGEFVNRQAAHLASRLEREAGRDPDKQIERAYALALCRPPQTKERAAMIAFLERQTEKLAKETGEHGKAISPDAARHEALVQLCRVIFNLNEFVYPD
jgi:hypothetical protein